MRRTMFHALVLAGVAVVCHTNAWGTESSDEIAEIRQQLRALSERVDLLEQENHVLRARNEQLSSRTNETASSVLESRQPPASATNKPQQAASWTEKVAIKSDLRYRHQQTSDESLNTAGVQSTADRSRDRIRARLGIELEASESISLGLGFATTEGGDPRSSNQTLDGVFSRKSFDLDLAYFDWDFSSWGSLVGGKMKQPFLVPGQSLFWDSDVNPEGLALKFTRGALFGSVYNYWVDEVSGPQNVTTSDTMLRGAQLGAQLPVGSSRLTLGAHYYDLSAGQGRAPFFNGNPYGNSVRLVNTGVGTVAVLANDFEVIDLMAQFDTKLGALPLQLWADVARNRGADDLDTAWTAGLMLGKASAPRSWEIGAAYQLLEKDALFAQFIDADFAGGQSDARGWMLRGAYVPVQKLVLNAAYFNNRRNMDVANSAGQRGVHYETLQLDVNVKF